MCNCATQQGYTRPFHSFELEPLSCIASATLVTFLEIIATLHCRRGCLEGTKLHCMVLPSVHVYEQLESLRNYEAATTDTIFGAHDSPGRAETLVRRGGITNHLLIAYCLSNISAKNYQNRLMCVSIIMCNISVVF